MNVSQLAVADTARIHLKNAAGEHLYTADGAKIEVEVYGPGSEPYAQLEARQSQRALKRMNDNEGKVTAASPDERRAHEATDLASITVAFHGLTLGDKSGTELSLAIYSDPKLGFIGKQVGKFVLDWGNFSGASTAS